MSSSITALICALFFFGDAGVFEGDQAFREGLVFEEGEFALGEAAGEERDAFTDQHWNHSDVTFVDQGFFKKIAREFAAAHQPDILAGALAELLDEIFWERVDESDATAFAGLLGMREDVALHF